MVLAHQQSCSTYVQKSCARFGASDAVEQFIQADVASQRGLILALENLMSYVLATTHSKVWWYKFKSNASFQEGDFILLNELDLHEVPCFGDKETAKIVAQVLGLRTSHYVKI